MVTEDSKKGGKCCKFVFGWNSTRFWCCGQMYVHYWVFVILLKQTHFMVLWAHFVERRASFLLFSCVFFCGEAKYSIAVFCSISVVCCLIYGSSSGSNGQSSPEKKSKTSEKETKSKELNTVTFCNGTPLYGHPLNTDILVLRPVLFVPKKISHRCLKHNPLITETRYYGQRTLFRVPSDKLL